MNFVEKLDFYAPVFMFLIWPIAMLVAIVYVLEKAKDYHSPDTEELEKLSQWVNEFPQLNSFLSDPVNNLMFNKVEAEYKKLKSKALASLND